MQHSVMVTRSFGTLGFQSPETHIALGFAYIFSVRRSNSSLQVRWVDPDCSQCCQALTSCSQGRLVHNGKEFQLKTKALGCTTIAFAFVLAHEYTCWSSASICTAFGELPILQLLLLAHRPESISRHRIPGESIAHVFLKLQGGSASSMQPCVCRCKAQATAIQQADIVICEPAPRRQHVRALVVAHAAQQLSATGVPPATPVSAGKAPAALLLLPPPLRRLSLLLLCCHTVQLIGSPLRLCCLQRLLELAGRLQTAHGRTCSGSFVCGRSALSRPMQIADPGIAVLSHLDFLYEWDCLQHLGSRVGSGFGTAQRIVHSFGS
jgi:hypothetical protein